jgi:hypothetical protein
MLLNAGQAESVRLPALPAVAALIDGTLRRDRHFT